MQAQSTGQALSSCAMCDLAEKNKKVSKPTENKTKQNKHQEAESRRRMVTALSHTRVITAASRFRETPRDAAPDQLRLCGTFSCLMAPVVPL